MAVTPGTWCRWREALVSSDITDPAVTDETQTHCYCYSATLSVIKPIRYFQSQLIGHQIAISLTYAVQIL